jgi:hypothetical protein
MCEGEASSYWVNVYRPLMAALGSVYSSREHADHLAGRDRLACVEVKAGVGLGAALFNLQRAAGDNE